MSTFTRWLWHGDFVVTAELNPPKSAAASVVRRRAGVLKGYVDAVNVTDSNRAVVAMAAIPAPAIVREMGVEPIVQMTGRDRSRIALQGGLLGAAALGLEHFLLMTGDDTRQGNHPEAVNVKDLGGTGLVRMAATMRDRAMFLPGHEIKRPPRYAIGATASPFTKPTEADVNKTVERIEAGADFVQAQPVFDLTTFSRWLSEVRRLARRQATIIAGVLAVRAPAQADRLGKVPGVALGLSLADRLRGADDADAEGVAMAIETVKSLRALPGAAWAACSCTRSSGRRESRRWSRAPAYSHDQR